MIKKLLPVIFLLVGLGGGIGAGVVLSPSDEVKPSDAKKADKADKTEAKEKKNDAKSKSADKKDKSGGMEYLKLTKQFVIPVVEAERISGMVTMSLSLEADGGISDSFYAIEPKLRDRFLQVLFDHANMGGFDGNFTTSDNLDLLRKALLEVAQKDLGKSVQNVLITSVNRQDI